MAIVVAIAMIVIALIPDVNAEEAGLAPALPKAAGNIANAITKAAAKLRIPEEQIAKISAVLPRAVNMAGKFLIPGKSMKSALEPAISGGLPEISARASQQLAKYMAENGGRGSEILRMLLSRSVRILARPVADFAGSEFTAILVKLMENAGRPERNFDVMYKVYQEMLRSVSNGGKTRYSTVRELIMNARSIELQEQAVQALKEANPNKTLLREPFKDEDVAARHALTGLDPAADPEGMLDNVVFDVYAPRSGTSAANIVLHIMNQKLGHQAYHFVINLTDSNASVGEIVTALEANKNGLGDLQEVIVYTRNGQLISNVVPWRK